MNDNSGHSVATAPQKTTLRQRFAALSPNQRAFAFVGLTLFVWVAIPMVGALAVANRAIDDGPDPGDYELMQEWDWWAFSPQFVGLALCGAAIVAIALLWNRPVARYAAMAFTFLTVFFAYEAHERRKLVPPVDLTLDTFFDWQPATSWAVMKTAADEDYLILIGPMRGILPSGPSAYVFDRNGDLVDWETDVADSVRFERRWLPWSWIPIDRQAAAEWKAKR